MAGKKDVCREAVEKALAQLLNSSKSEQLKFVQRHGLTHKQQASLVQQAGIDQHTLKLLLLQDKANWMAGNPGKFSATVRDLMSIYKGSWVGDLNSQIRNVTGGFTNMGIDAMTQAVAAGVERVARGASSKVGPAQHNWADGMDQFLLLLSQQNKADLANLMKAWPDTRSALFSFYAQNVPLGGASGKVLGSARNAVEKINIINRMGQDAQHRVVLSAELGRLLRNEGLDLDDILQRDLTSLIPKEIMDKAVEKALDVTSSLSPEKRWAKGLLNFVNGFGESVNLPVLQVLQPFFKYSLWTVKFATDRGPMAWGKLFSKDAYRKMAAGDGEEIAKGLLSAGGLVAAMMLQQSKYQGPQWYLLGTKEDGYTDIRPVPALAQFMALANIVNRNSLTGDNTLRRMDLREWISMLIGSTGSFKFGAGGYATDKLAGVLSGDVGTDDWKTAMKKIFGETFAFSTAWLRSVRGFYDHATNGFTKYRDKDEQPFLGPMLENVPGLSQDLKPVQEPTRVGPRKFEPYISGPAEKIIAGDDRFPAVLRLVFGLRKEFPLNPAEEELQSHDFSYYDVLPASGVHTVDKKRAAELAKLVEKRMVPFVKSAAYTKKSWHEKDVALANYLKDVIRPIAYARAKNKITNEEEKLLKLKRTPHRERRAASEEAMGWSKKTLAERLETLAKTKAQESPSAK